MKERKIVGSDIGKMITLNILKMNLGFLEFCNNMKIKLLLIKLFFSYDVVKK